MINLLFVYRANYWNFIVLVQVFYFALHKKNAKNWPIVPWGPLEGVKKQSALKSSDIIYADNLHYILLLFN